jgi:hypothetical protein
MRDNKGFVYSGMALLLAIPGIILVASLVNMMETGDMTTSLVLRSDAVFYPCEDVKSAFEFSANNFALTFNINASGIEDRFNNVWLSQINSYYADAGVSVTLSDIDVIHDSSTNSIIVFSGTQDKGINISIVDSKGETKCETTSGPHTINIGEDTEGPNVFFITPGNWTHCPIGTDLNLSYLLSEAAINESYVVNGISNVTGETQGTNITLGTADGLVPGVNYIEVYATDSSGNNGSGSIYFYIKNYSYVNSSNLLEGFLSGSISDAQAADGVNLNLSEVNATGIDEHPTNRLLSNDVGWTEFETGLGMTNQWDAFGNPAGSGSVFTSITGTGSEDRDGTGTWYSNFSYNSDNAGNATLITFSIDYYLSEFQNAEGTNKFEVWLEFDGGPLLLYSEPDLSLITEDEWISSGLLSNPTWNNSFKFSGEWEYNITILTTLDVQKKGAGVQVYFDNVEFDIYVPGGFKYQIQFETLDTLDMVNWSNHDYQIGYSMPVDPENTIFEVWDPSSNSFAQLNTLSGVSVANFSMIEDTGFGLSLEQYNNGNITTRFRDQLTTDTAETQLLIDYMRVC